MVLLMKHLLRDTRRNESRKSSVEADPIAFLVRFANADLEQFREGDWLNLRDDLAALARALLSGPLILTLMPTNEPRRLGAVDSGEYVEWLQLQDNFRRVLRTVAASQSPIDPQGLSSGAIELVTVGISVAADPTKGPCVELSGEYPTLLFVKAVLLLAAEPAAARLRLCPECESMFLRIRKQQYCGRKCVNKANMRAWLGRQHGKASHRASSRRSYVKRTHARTSANVRIARRERNGVKAK